MTSIRIPVETRPTSDRMAILLCELQAATSITEERQRGHWINVSSHLWRRVLGRNYGAVISSAKALGYVETNDCYSVGRFSKSIRLAKQYRTFQTSQYRLQRRLGGGLDYRIRLAPEDATGLALASCFDRVSLPVNVASAAWDSYSVRSIDQREYYVVRCPYGRLHSTFTGLPKKIRSQITIDDKPTIETDIANCQPLILGIQTTHYNQPTTTTHTRPTHQPPTPDPHTICGALSDYLFLCGNGQLYDYLLDKCGGLTLWDTLPQQFRHQYAQNRPLTRSDIKGQFIVMMFAPVETTQRMAIFEVVAKEFPEIADYVIHAKRSEYQELARQCQRLESQLMIDVVASKLVSRLPVVTVHDSIISEESSAPFVASTIRESFYPFNVTIKQG